MTPIENIKSKLRKTLKYSTLTEEEKDNFESLAYALRNGLIDNPAAIPERFLKDKDSAIKILRLNGAYFKYMPDFHDDEEMAFIAIENQPSAAKFCSPRLAAKEDFILKTLYYGFPAWDYSKYSKDFIIEMCIANPLVLDCLHDDLKTDIDILKPMFAYSPNFYVSHDIPKEVLMTPEIAKIILSRDGTYIGTMGDLANDIEYARIALANNPKAYFLLSDKLKENLELIEMTRGKIPWTSYSPEVAKTLPKEFLIESIKSGRTKDVDKYYLEDEDVQRALLEMGNAFYLEGGVKNKNIAMLYMKTGCSDKRIWINLSDDLKKDRQFILDALPIHFLLYKYLPEELQKDEEIIEAMLEDKRLPQFSEFPLKYLPANLQHDIKFVKKVLEKYPEEWSILTNDMQTKETLVFAIKHGLDSKYITSPFDFRDKDIVEAYIEHPEGLQIDRLPRRILTQEMVLDLIDRGACISENSYLFKDREILLAYISAGKYSLHRTFLTPFSNDLEVAIASVRRDAQSARCFSEAFYENPKFLEAIQECGKERGFMNIPEEYLTKDLLLSQLSKDNVDSFWLSYNRPREITEDFDVILKACQLSGNIDHVDPIFLDNREFMEKAAPYCPDAVRALERMDFMELYRNARAEATAEASVEV